MSGGDQEKVSITIQRVRKHIEWCLLHYMNKKEVVHSLYVRDNIEPCITDRVWQGLERDNQEFFKAYHLNMLVKEQILEFNRLLTDQVELMHRIRSTDVAPVLISNGTLISPTQQITTSRAQNTMHMNGVDMQQPNVFNSCGSPVRSCKRETVDGSFHTRNIDVHPSLFLSQNANMGLAQTTNGEVVSIGAGYAGSSSFLTNQHMNFQESSSPVGDAYMSSFRNVECNAQNGSDALLAGDASSFDFLAPFPPSFNLPELSADIIDLLETSCGSTDANNFQNPHGSC